MSLMHFLLSFLQPIGVGAGVVIALIIMVRLTLPGRSAPMVSRSKPERRAV